MEQTGEEQGIELKVMKIGPDAEKAAKAPTQKFFTSGEQTTTEMQGADLQVLKVDISSTICRWTDDMIRVIYF